MTQININDLEKLFIAKAIKYSETFMMPDRMSPQRFRTEHGMSKTEYKNVIKQLMLKIK